MNKKAFTLVELIIVMSILVILSSMGFFGYVGYLTDTKDTNRVTQVHTIGDGIDLALGKGISLVPEDSIQINVMGQKYSTQGVAGKLVIGKIKYFSTGLDPRDNKPFTFSLGVNGREYDIYTLLENEDNLPKKSSNGIVNYTNNEKIPYVYGKNNIGILVDSDYVPLNLTASGTINIDCTTDSGYKLIFSNGEILSPIITQSLYKDGPCYSDPGKTCKPQPSISNASFNIGSPNEANQDWIKGNNTQSCSYQCINGYTGIFCEKEPIKTEAIVMANEAFKNVIVDKCLVPKEEFETKFNESNGNYNGTISCANKNLRDDDLDLFLPLRSITGDLILGDNYANPDRNIFSDTEGLANLRIVNKLSIRYTNLTDISGLSTISTINELDLSYNTLANLTPISTITSLKKLELESSGIINISPLQTLLDLETLNLSKNSITDISSLVTLLKLDFINISDTNIIEINSLAGSVNLKQLYMSSTSISDLSPLSNFPNMTHLDISNNLNVFDISSVVGLNKLYSLNIVGAGITDLSTIDTFFTTSSDFIFYVDNDAYSTKMISTSPICTNYYTGGPTPLTYQVIFNDMSGVANTGTKKHYICN